MKRCARLVVLASGEGTTLQAVLDACRDGRVCAQVVGVVSDRDAYALERARRLGISAVWMKPKVGSYTSEGRVEYDREVAGRVLEFAPDVVVFAGWMRIVTSTFLRAFSVPIINVHPALPGAFPGVDAMRRAWEAWELGDVVSTGVMVHEVVEEVDGGPVLGSVCVGFREGESYGVYESRMRGAERGLLVAVLASLCGGGVV